MSESEVGVNMAVTRQTGACGTANRTSGSMLAGPIFWAVRSFAPDKEIFISPSHNAPCAGARHRRSSGIWKNPVLFLFKKPKRQSCMWIGSSNLLKRNNSAVPLSNVDRDLPAFRHNRLSGPDVRCFPKRWNLARQEYGNLRRGARRISDPQIGSS